MDYDNFRLLNVGFAAIDMMQFPYANRHNLNNNKERCIQLRFAYKSVRSLHFLSREKSHFNRMLDLFYIIFDVSTQNEVRRIK